jgi:hypothetical protein
MAARAGFMYNILIDLTGKIGELIIALVESTFWNSDKLFIFIAFHNYLKIF